MSNPAFLAPLLARWNVDESPVPESVERALTAVPIMDGGRKAYRWNPRLWDDRTESGYSCKAGGYGCMHIQPIKVPTMTVSAGHSCEHIDKGDTFPRLFSQGKHHHRHQQLEIYVINEHFNGDYWSHVGYERWNSYWRIGI